jgi:hypothetical protein
MDEQRAYHLLEKSIEIIKAQGGFQDDKRFEKNLTEKLGMTDNEFRDLYYRTDGRIERLWNDLTDNLFVEKEGEVRVLKDDWNGFAKGTDREVIRDWFDWHYSKNINWLEDN